VANLGKAENFGALRRGPVRESYLEQVQRFIKRAMDLLGASVLLILLAPVFFWVGLAVKADGGPVFFGHERVGRGGRRFMCLKFRTMRVDARDALERHLAENPEARREWEVDFKLRNDPRVTPIGLFLRRTSIDELPQLFNVLAGDMSLVGPRPITAVEMERYGRNIAFYLKRRPGLTGPWQVSGRNETNYEQRVALDTRYGQKMSIWQDCVILVRTLQVVISRRGAY